MTSEPAAPDSVSPPGSAAADVAVARKLLTGGAKTIALVPASHDIATWPLLLRLAGAFRLLGQGRVGIVRAPDPEGQPRVDEGRPGPEDTYRMVELDREGATCELILPPALGLGESVRHLATALVHADRHFDRLLLAFDRYVPDVREALGLPDAFVSAARAGRTREDDLAALVRLLPPARHLGTILLD